MVIEVGSFPGHSQTINAFAKWNWKVDAKGARGKTRVGRSPENRLTYKIEFRPKLNGKYKFELPYSLSGRYEVKANQVGAGGRQAIVEISTFEKIQLASTNAYIRNNEVKPPLYFQKVTKGGESGPIRQNWVYTRIFPVNLSTPGSTTIEFLYRIQLYTYAKWNKSYALLDFIRSGNNPAISLGPIKITYIG